MLLRKVNAGLSLITSYLLLDHAMFNGFWMLSGFRIPKNANSMPWLLAGFMMAHAISGIVLGIMSHKGVPKIKCKKYSGMNTATVIQRISGILILPFTILHIGGISGLIHTSQIVHAINPPLFFAIALLHISVSLSKSFITLGIGNAKFIKTVDIAIKIICAVTLIIDVIGFYLYVC